eukprot:6626711-Heterocapsa_arctica.AAC.1
MHLDVAEAPLCSGSFRSSRGTRSRGYDPLNGQRAAPDYPGRTPCEEAYSQPVHDDAKLLA